MEEANSGWSMIFILDLNCHVQDFWWFFPMFFSSIISPCWDQRPTDQLVDRSGIPTMLLMELSDPNFADQNAAFVLREFISSCLYRRGRWKDFWNGKNFHLGIITTQKKNMEHLGTSTSSQTSNLQLQELSSIETKSSTCGFLPFISISRCPENPPSCRGESSGSFSENTTKIRLRWAPWKL